MRLVRTVGIEATRTSRVVAGIVALALMASLGATELTAAAKPDKHAAAVVYLRHSVDSLGTASIEVSPKRVFICAKALGKGEYCPNKIRWVVESAEWTQDLKINSVVITPVAVKGQNGKDLFDAQIKIENVATTDDYNSVEAELNDIPKWTKKTPKGTEYEQVVYTVTATIDGQSVTVDPDIIIKKGTGG